jgi:serine/threonine protein kinase
VILGTGHGPAVDWWALGVIMIEFLTGWPPFHDESPQQIFGNILGLDFQSWPEVEVEVSVLGNDLLRGLLSVSPNDRIGALGAVEVKHHRYFQGLNWHELIHQKAVFVPDLKDATDTSYFDPGKFEVYVCVCVCVSALYIYMCVLCVCVCVHAVEAEFCTHLFTQTLTFTPTHTHTTSNPTHITPQNDVVMTIQRTRSP